ncbi:hypothetical protein O9A_01455 [Bartonella koehlerae C-29]|uniref:Uncharacterized protein n=1 Tax=Bartonella koehlerae C-29 TaxID=1134510 RepID=A0A067W2N1_9HYPH|nr:hypothetical protein O9A_01448 [Bartonella koehlerae C-29]KEC54065.1 hypothetical protein O9A_01455 [Bartonella koehlerae C-29]
MAVPLYHSRGYVIMKVAWVSALRDVSLKQVRELATQ